MTLKKFAQKLEQRFAARLGMRLSSEDTREVLKEYQQAVKDVLLDHVSKEGENLD